MELESRAINPRGFSGFLKKTRVILIASLFYFVSDNVTDFITTSNYLKKGFSMYQIEQIILMSNEELFGSFFGEFSLRLAEPGRKIAYSLHRKKNNYNSLRHKLV